MRQRVEAQLRREVFAPRAGADLVVSGSVEPLEAGFRARIALSDASGAAVGERTLVAETGSCSTLDDSLSLVLSLMLDVPKEELEHPAPRPDAARPRAVTPLVVAPPRAGAADPWAAELTLGAVASAGLLPGAGVALAAEGALDPPGFPLFEVEAARFFRAETTGDPGGVHLDLATVGVVLCPLGGAIGRLRLHACIGQRVGSLAATGFGFTRTADSRHLVLDALAAARASLTLVGPLTLRASAAVELPLARDRFYFRTPEGAEHDLFRMAPVAATGQLGLGLLVP